METTINKIIELCKKLIDENKERFFYLKGIKNWDSMEEIKRNIKILEKFALDIGLIFKAALEFVLGEDGKLDKNDKERIIKEIAPYLNIVFDIPIIGERIEQFILELILNIVWDSIISIKDKIFVDRVSSYTKQLKEISRTA